MYRDEPPKIIEAQEFRLVDEAGKPRAMLQMMTDGHPCLSLLDSEGQPVVSVDVAQDDGARIILRDANGRPRIVMQIADGERPIIRLHDHSRQTRIIIGRDEQQYWSVRLMRGGRLIWRTPTYGRGGHERGNGDGGDVRRGWPWRVFAKNRSKR